MKFHRYIIVLAGATLTLSLSNCGKSEGDKTSDATKTEAPETKPAAAPKMDEKTAVAKFQDELKAAKTYMDSKGEEGKKAAETNPMAAMVPMKAVCARMKEVKAVDLPADLKSAWDGMVDAFNQMGDLFKDFPDKPEDLTAWVTKNVGTDQAAVQKWQVDFMTKMQKVGEAGDAASKKFKEVAKKYNIDVDLMK